MFFLMLDRIREAYLKSGEKDRSKSKKVFAKPGKHMKTGGRQSKAYAGAVVHRTSIKMKQRTSTISTGVLNSVVSRLAPRRDARCGATTDSPFSGEAARNITPQPTLHRPN